MNNLGRGLGIKFLNKPRSCIWDVGSGALLSSFSSSFTYLSPLFLFFPTKEIDYQINITTVDNYNRLL
jgi:hypothetical protein